jgi:hypothetical protein
MREYESRRHRDWAADWQRQKAKRQARDGGTMVTVTEGPPNTTVAVTLWALE